MPEDERYNSAKQRKIHSEDLVNELDLIFAGRTLTEWKKRLDANDVVWAPFQSAAEVVKDPQAIAAGAFVEMPDHAGGTYRAPAGPVRFHGKNDGPKGPSPHIGQHTNEVLKSIGYSDEDVENLRQAKVIS